MPDRYKVPAAAARIAPHLRRTPVMRLKPGELGPHGEIVLKLELLQCAGSFKPRGAFNRILSAGDLPASGVIAASGGNHGAAVAYAAQALGVRAEIFVPELATAAKIARIASYGAAVTRIGATYAEALAASADRAAATGALVVHAYDQAEVLEGQATAGKEFLEDAPEVTHLLVATGGGGLIGGTALWVEDRAAIVSVEPEGCPALHDALRAGQPVDAAVGGIAADSLGARRVGTLMFALARRFVPHAVLVTDQAIRAAQQVLWDRLRLVAEPGGATALAGLLSGAFAPPPGAVPGVLVCGANADPATVV
jgi:threonine dehydratase